MHGSGSINWTFNLFECLQTMDLTTYHYGKTVCKYKLKQLYDDKSAGA
jgi:hypothetical protein